MQTAYRVTVILALLAVVIIMSASSALGSADHWQVLDEGASIEQGGSDRAGTRSVYATYLDDQRERAETPGIVGLLVNYYVAILVVVAIAGVSIAVWVTGRRSRAPVRDDWTSRLD